MLVDSEIRERLSHYCTVTKLTRVRETGRFRAPVSTPQKLNNM